MGGDVAERARDLIRQICESRELKIIRGAVSPDHIHLLIAAPPHLAPSKIVQYIKGALVATPPGRIPCAAKTLLGTTPMGAWVLLRDAGRGGRENDNGLHREPKVGRRRSGLQDHSAHGALSRLSAGTPSDGFSRTPRLSVAAQPASFSW